MWTVPCGTCRSRVLSVVILLHKFVNKTIKRVLRVFFSPLSKVSKLFSMRPRMSLFLRNINPEIEFQKPHMIRTGRPSATLSVRRGMLKTILCFPFHRLRDTYLSENYKQQIHIASSNQFSGRETGSNISYPPTSRHVEAAELLLLPRFERQRWNTCYMIYRASSLILVSPCAATFFPLRNSKLAWNCL